MLLANEAEQKEVSLPVLLVLKVLKGNKDAPPESIRSWAGYKGLRTALNSHPGHRIKRRSLLYV